ncbi:unnamed protein product [Moneuplotes crassus]|uniref:MSP domain-containing protein n=2 Tax=Euplotes crassus TaxID=5936 RepID=A0AAD1XU76_EUPCR|nr:unnamed protein product [Moneuplotes crassus]
MEASSTSPKDTIIELNPESQVTFVKKDIASLPETTLEVKNNSDKTVLFKIKTTDPAKYLVKPNHGVLSSAKGTKILITTQKPTMQKIKNDRFLVVAIEFEGDKSEIPSTPNQVERFMKTYFDNAPKEKLFMKKLKIVNDETLGLTYASFKGNRTSIIKPGEDPSDLRSSGVVLNKEKSSHVELEEKYNDIVSKVNQLTTKKVELANIIKTKTKNLQLIEKARYAQTGRDSSMAKPADSEGNFSLIHIAGVFILFFVIGIYYSSG